MLVLSRRVDETVVLPNLGVTVRILRLKGQQVRIGVEAPRDVQVLRGELSRRSQLDSPRPAAQAAGEFHAHLADADELLQRLKQSLEARRWREAAPLIGRLLKELKLIDQRVGELTSAAEPASAAPRGRALLVDDNKNETRLLSSYLRLKNFEVDTAENGADAMHYLSHHAIPDVLLLDMQMPRFDGRWTVGEIRTNPKYDGLKIIAVSGIHPSEYGVKFGGGGVNQWFRKPLDPEQLVQEIANGMEEDTASVA